MDVAGSELDFFKQKVSQVTGDLSRTLTNLNHLMEANAQTHHQDDSGHLDTQITGDRPADSEAQPESRRRQPYGVLRDARREPRVGHRQPVSG